MSGTGPGDPHASSFVVQAGTSLDEAEGAVILLHGRGGSAAEILQLNEVMQPGNGGPKLAWLAPEAAGKTWYPNSFMAPRAANEPYLSSALGRINALVTVIEQAGIPPGRIVLAGFSQGACLASEYVASHAARYAGLIAFTGGLIGAPGSDLTHRGDLQGTPVLLLSGDPDPHVPWSRIEETAAELKRMGASVTTKCYPGRAHTVSQDEVAQARGLLERAFAGAAARRA